MRGVPRPCLLSLVLLLVFAFTLLGCGSAEELQLSFDSGNGSCAAVNVSTASISLWGDRVAFSGVVLTPNPCYRLEAAMELLVAPSPSGSGSRQLFMVNITALSSLGPGQDCIECIGAVPFQGEVFTLARGQYDIEILYGGSVIAGSYNLSCPGG